MTDAEQIAAFIAERGVTKCPTVALVETPFVALDPLDILAAAEHKRQRYLHHAMTRARAMYKHGWCLNENA